jgi:hypothetical protein
MTIYDGHSAAAQYLVIVEFMTVARWNRPCETVEMTLKRQADVASNLAVFFDGIPGNIGGSYLGSAFGAAMALISTAELGK